MIIDDREAKQHPLWLEDSPYLPGTLRYEGFEPVVQRLQYGDFLMDNILVEHKTWPDFVASFRDRAENRADSRIREQLSGLLEHSGPSVLLLTGELLHRGSKVTTRIGRSQRTQSWGWFEPVSAMLAVQHLGVYIYLSPNFDEVPHSLRLILHTLSQSQHFGPPGLARVSGLSPRLDNLATVLTAVPGVGAETAKSLAAEFESFKEFYGQEEEGLRKAEGVGKVMAGRIYGFFHD